MNVSYGGLLLFAAGLAGALHVGPGIAFLLLLAGIPVFVRMLREHADPQGARTFLNWVSATFFYAVALLLLLSPLLFTAAFAALWVVCAAVAANFDLSAAPAEVESTQVILSVTMGLFGLGLQLRRTLLAASNSIPSANRDDA